MSAPPWDFIAKLVCIGDSGCGKSSLTIRLCEGRFVPHHDVTIGVEFGSRIVPVGPPHSNSLLPGPASHGLQQPEQRPWSQSTSATAVGSITAPDHVSKSGPGAGALALGKSGFPAGLPRPPVVANDPPQKHMKLSLWDTAGQETYKSVTRSYFRGASGALLVFDLCRRETFEHAIDWLNDLRQIAEPDIVVVLVGNKADLAATEDGSAGSGNDGRSSGGDETNGAGGPGGKGAERQQPRTQQQNQQQTQQQQQQQQQLEAAPIRGCKREVTRDEAEGWARRNGVLEYVETSAKSGEGVERAFSRVAERIFHNIMAGRYDLNDRRSGVKGPSAAGFGGGGGASGASNQVRLGKPANGAGGGGGCC